MISYRKPERLTLKAHPELNEQWVQKLIEDDPSILGLGDLQFRGRERIQPGGGRLDLLLQDPETDRRYEVELQLGATDPSHIIRTIEYWDIERKRYPQYEHCAVLIAEEITSRFLNVISLFNGTIPLIAIQMQGLKVGDYTTLTFTKVMDVLNRGLIDEDEEAAAIPADRTFWIKGYQDTLTIADKLLSIAQGFDPSITLNYTRSYIGLGKGRRYFLFIHPRKQQVLLQIRLKESDDIDNKIDEAGISRLGYTNWGTYQLRLRTDEVEKNVQVLGEVIQLAIPPNITG